MFPPRRAATQQTPLSSIDRPFFPFITQSEKGQRKEENQDIGTC